MINKKIFLPNHRIEEWQNKLQIENLGMNLIWGLKTLQKLLSKNLSIQELFLQTFFDIKLN